MRKNIALLFLGMICFVNCIVPAIAGDRVEEEYLVEINDIKMQRSAAENVFRYIEGRAKAIDAAGVVVTELKKWMKVTIDDGLMKAISTMYNLCLGKISSKEFEVTLDDDDEKCGIANYYKICGAGNCDRNDARKTIGICVDKKNKAVTNLINA